MWIHPPERCSDKGSNASINLDLVVGITVEEVLITGLDGSTITEKTETRINFITTAEFSPYWTFDKEDDYKKALDTLKRANAWK